MAREKPRSLWRRIVRMGWRRPYHSYPPAFLLAFIYGFLGALFRRPKFWMALVVGAIAGYALSQVIAR